MEFKAVNQARHSVRDFSDRQVSLEQIRQIVKQAQQAPSWVNAQPWKVYVATGKTLERVREMSHHQDDAHVKGNPDLKVMSREDWAPVPQANMKEWGHRIVGHFENYDEAHQTMSGLAYDLNHAPVIAYITIPKQSPDWAIFDAGAFAQTMMLAAKDLGIDSIPTYNSVRFPEQLREILAIPNDERIIVGIELGYAKDTKVNQYRSTRQALDKILKIED